MFDTYTDIFNQRGQDYHQAMIDYPSARHEEFAMALSLLDPLPGQTVCDVPSGGCYLRRYLMDSVKIISIETSVEFLRRSAQQPNNLPLLCEDLAQLPLRTSSVERVLCLAGSHHLPDRPSFIREAFRILKPGGRLVLADGFEGSSVASFLNGFVDQHSSMGHRGNFLNHSTRTELETVGFQVDVCESIPYAWSFTDESALVRGCTLMFGIDRATPAQVLAGLQSYLGYARQGRGFQLNWELYFLVGKKALPVDCPLA